jgi:hypothetical protein
VDVHPLADRACLFKPVASFWKVLAPDQVTAER